MKKSIQNRTIALAAVLQCSAQVKQVAESGQTDLQQARVLLKSLFNNDASSIDSVYGGLSNIKPGLILINDYLNAGKNGVKDMDITRYSVSVMYLQGKLDKNQAAGKQMLEELESAEQQLNYFDDVLHPSVVGRIADIYQNHISPLGSKIIVKGDQNQLENPDNAAMIRALLLAGIRACVLWRQAGGSRLKLLFQRGGLLKETHAMLNQL